MSNAITIGEFNNSDLSTYKLSVYSSPISHDLTLQLHEVEILKSLVRENPTTFSQVDVVSEDVSEAFNHHVMVHNDYNDSNIAMSFDFKTGTPIITSLKNYNEKQNTTKQYAIQHFTKVVELDNDSAALYNGSIKIEYTDGDSEYLSSVGEHYLSFDTTDPDYNIQKSMNSTLSNINSSATDGFQGSFDNTFNHQYAFYTENILSRNSENNIVEPIPSTTLGSEGISSTSGDVVDSNWAKLEAEILSSSEFPDNHPLFGSLKFVQDDLECDFPAANNNNDSNSTLSKLLNSDSQFTNVSQPDSELSEEQFKSLFTQQQLEEVGPGYDFKLNTTVATTDGYRLLDSTNTISIPNYNSDNTSTSATSSTMFTIDDNSILKNVQYMKEMKDKNYFNNNSHKFYLKNGEVHKDPNSSSNPNFDKFTVLDGVERLIATNNTDIEDLTRNGIISVIDTNNTLGHLNARSKKYADNTYASEISSISRINKLVVNYSDTEPDYRQDTGSIDEDFKNHYYVQSEVSTLNISTSSNHNVDYFNPNIYPDINAARGDNSVLVFQSQFNSPLYNSTNIHSYEASGLDTFIPNDKFALFSLNKTLYFEDCDESPLFKTIDNTALEGIVSNVSINNLDLTKNFGDDIRVLIHGKKKQDMPSPTNILWRWCTGDDINGNLLDYNTDSNNQYIISEKTGNDYLGSKMYDLLKIDDPNLETTVTFKLLTDSNPLPSKDVLSRKVQISIDLPSQINSDIQDVDVDDKDLVFFNISETTSNGVEQSLIGLSVPSYYQVKHYTTTKEYHLGIRFKVGPYKNLWLVTYVKEFTEWYQLKNMNKNNQIMPDYYLNRIIDQGTGTQKFKASRKFMSQTNPTLTVTSLSTTVRLKVKDFMGFKASVEYKNGTNWTPFPLKPDLNYQYSLDPMYDKNSVITLMNPNSLSDELGDISIAVDSPIFKSLGLNSHISLIDNPNYAMYQININIPLGSLSFTVTGYEYNVATDSRHFNKNASWNPYSVGDNLFLKNSSGSFVGNQINNLSTNVELLDPTLNETTNVNEVNEVKVTVKYNSIVLFSFVSKILILENFNVIIMKQVILQHDYLVNKTGYVQTGALYSGTEYLSSSYVGTNLDIVKLNFGSSHNGIRLEVAPAPTAASGEGRVSTSYFRLSSDCVQIKPLNETSNSNDNNKYNGRYSSLTEKIIPSDTGYPLPTNSVIHRNIYPTIFRGLKNEPSPINIIRTMTKIKLVIGDKFVDDMNVTNDTNIGAVWTNKSLFNGVDCTLRAMKLFKAQTSFSQSQLENMDIVLSNPIGSNSDIGSLGLKVKPQFSMFPTAISPTLHIINILLSPSSYEKIIVNPLDPTINETVSSNLFDYKLHEFKDFSLVAARIKAYNDEKYNFKYVIPDLKVYHSPNYIGNPKTITNWTLIQENSDGELRNGVVIGSGTSNGVVKFTKNQNFVSSFIKYCILARPIATLSSYNIKELQESLPHDYTPKSYQREAYGIDINITNQSGGQGIAANSQTHKPFQVNFTDNANEGLNNVRLGFNIAKYLECKEQSLLPFSFQMTSNKIKISNGIGLTSNFPIYTEIFNGYISELSTSTKWHSELRASINNIFNTSSKRWNLSIKQLTQPVAQFLSLNPTTVSGNNVMINGITSFGMGSYNLDLALLDSVTMRHYTANYIYDVLNEKQKVVFNRYTTAEGLPWITQDDFSRSSLFKPLIVTKETCEIEVSVPNLLGDNPYNVNTLIKNNIVSSDFSNISWSRDTGFTSTSSPISFITLSKLGAGALNDSLYVNKNHPFKVLTGYRPFILDIKRADGSRAFAITNDGKLVCYKHLTKQVELLPQTNYTSSTFNDLTSVFNDHHINT